MNIVLLSGGSGTRLWSLSNDVRSKQFIKLFKDENDEYESMVQRVYRQIVSVDKDAKVTIATSKTQVSAILNQLGENVSVCVEPMRRDTFPAIALASAYLHDELNLDPEEAVVVCPVDPYVDDSYYQAVADLEKLVLEGKNNLTLMGIEPTYPSEKYGYIIPESKDKVSPVKEFKEKPDRSTAEQYLSVGALWNAGVFAFKLGYLLDKAHELIDFTDYRDLYAKYANCPNPVWDGWEPHNIFERVTRKIKREAMNRLHKPQIYQYDKIWKKILKTAQATDNNTYLSGFVSYDDSPRRGINAKIVVGETPEKFQNYLRKLIRISAEQNKELLLITAWNEWGEGAYLEPDQDFKYGFLEAVKKVRDFYENNA